VQEKDLKPQKFNELALTQSTIQIRSNCIIGYQQLVDYQNNSSAGRWRPPPSQPDPSKATYSGQLKQGTKRRLTKAIDLLVQSSTLRKIWDPQRQRIIKHRLSFITLTVHQSGIITARAAHEKLLSHFLQWLRRTMKVNTYIWKAEVQKRGQIHYHITTPSYIPHQKIKDKWNELQQREGLLEEYYNKKGHYNPNSTDIGEVRQVENMTGYLCKEFCKSIQNPYNLLMMKPTADLKKGLITPEEFNVREKAAALEVKSFGKLWDCSLNLKTFKRFSIPESHDIYFRLQEMIQKNLVWLLKLEQCWIIELPRNDLTQLLSLDKIHAYDEFLQLIRTYERDSPKVTTTNQPIEAIATVDSEAEFIKSIQGYERKSTKATPSFKSKQQILYHS